MGDNQIVWLIGVLVVAVLAVQVVIPTAITAAAGVTTTGTATGELDTGTALTPFSLSYYPVTSITAFKKAAVITVYNDTKLAGARGAVTVPIDAYAANGGVAWEGVNITFTLQGVNATNNVTWVTGTCRGGNATWISSPQAYTAIASTCLTPGSTLTFNFVNTTLEDPSNVTNVSVTYYRYVDNTAYTLSGANGQITPTLGGYYYTSYGYGTTTNNTVNVVLLLLPLLIAVVVLMLFLKSSGFF